MSKVRGSGTGWRILAAVAMGCLSWLAGYVFAITAVPARAEMAQMAFPPLLLLSGILLCAVLGNLAPGLARAGGAAFSIIALGLIVAFMIFDNSGWNPLTGVETHGLGMIFALGLHIPATIAALLGAGLCFMAPRTLPAQGGRKAD